MDRKFFSKWEEETKQKSIKVLEKFRNKKIIEMNSQELCKLKYHSLKLLDLTLKN